MVSGWLLACKHRTRIAAIRPALPAPRALMITGIVSQSSPYLQTISELGPALSDELLVGRVSLGALESFDRIGELVDETPSSCYIGRLSLDVSEQSPALYWAASLPCR